MNSHRKRLAARRRFQCQLFLERSKEIPTFSSPHNQCERSRDGFIVELQVRKHRNLADLCRLGEALQTLSKVKLMLVSLSWTDFQEMGNLFHSVDWQIGKSLFSVCACQGPHPNTVFFFFFHTFFPGDLTSLRNASARKVTIHAAEPKLDA